MLVDRLTEQVSPYTENLVAPCGPWKFFCYCTVGSLDVLPDVSVYRVSLASLS